VNDYTNLLRSEERKFELGESSLFLVNTRESKLIEAELKAIQVQNKFVNVKATLFRIFNGTI
ncbi:MAG: transporter, partial [Flavobacteriaceae bacterium]